MVALILGVVGYIPTALLGGRKSVSLQKIMILPLLCMDFLSFSLHVYESRFVYLSLLDFCLCRVALSRASLYKIAQKFKSSWFVPTVVIGDAATAEDLLFAFASDIGTGYRTETIFIRSSAEDFEFDLSDMPFPPTTSRLSIIPMHW